MKESLSAVASDLQTDVQATLSGQQQKQILEAVCESAGLQMEKGGL